MIIQYDWESVLIQRILIGCKAILECTKLQSDLRKKKSVNIGIMDVKSLIRNSHTETGKTKKSFAA